MALFAGGVMAANFDEYITIERYGGDMLSLKLNGGADETLSEWMNNIHDSIDAQPYTASMDVVLGGADTKVYLFSGFTPLVNNKANTGSIAFTASHDIVTQLQNKEMKLILVKDFTEPVKVGEASTVTVNAATDTISAALNTPCTIDSADTTDEPNHTFLLLVAGGSGPTPAEKVKTPVADPEAGTYKDAQSVELTCATASADIYYTLDGTAPTETSTKYTTPISVDKDMTIKAIAIKTDMASSDVLTAAYKIGGSGGGSSSSGCSAGFAALALLAFVPVVIRRKK